MGEVVGSVGALVGDTEGSCVLSVGDDVGELDGE